MNYFKNLVSVLALLSQAAYAGLPPTTTKGSGDSTPVTTFEIDTPNIPITHTGTKASLGVVAIAGGGTGQATKAAAFDALSCMTTGGDLIYGGASGTCTRLANGSLGQALLSGGGTAAPTWGAATATVITAAPTTQVFNSGSGTYNKDYTFVITSGSATVGATYTNNAVTFTVYATVASATKVVMSGSGAPASSGTLTKSAGTGDSTLTFSQVLAPLYLRVRAVGGGGGGGGNGTGATAGAGGVGGDTTFSSYTAGGGGSGGIATGGSANDPGLGGTASGSPTISFAGGNGSRGIFQASATVDNTLGGFGGVSFFGGGGNIAAPANTGSGGAGGLGSTAVFPASGGGAGAYIETIIAPPSATYSYGVGAAGTAGTAGTSGHVGYAGGAGKVIVEEFYQ